MKITKNHLLALFILKTSISLLGVLFVMDEIALPLTYHGFENIYQFYQGKVAQFVTTFDREFMIYKGVNW